MILYYVLVELYMVMEEGMIMLIELGVYCLG